MSDWKKYEVQLVRVGNDGARTRVQSPEELASLFTEYADQVTKEALFVVAFDGQNGVIGINKVYEGTATGTSVRITEILQPVMVMNAAGLAVVHNHPSGDPVASDADIQLTKELIEAAKIMDFMLLDHVVIGANGRHSSIRRDNQDLDWQS